MLDFYYARHVDLDVALTFVEIRPVAVSHNNATKSHYVNATGQNRPVFSSGQMPRTDVSGFLMSAGIDMSLSCAF